MFDNLAAILSIVAVLTSYSQETTPSSIGMAARNLSEENRRRAIIPGGAGAIGVLRILFTALSHHPAEVSRDCRPLAPSCWIPHCLQAAASPRRRHGNVHEADTLSRPRARSSWRMWS